ncbi:hypothetical protein [Streptomyces fragilis]|nr:hypothetical protein [Streptomyces fragilis]
MCIRDRHVTGITPAPVSYTHLDVYKRQARHGHHPGACLLYPSRCV